MCLKDKDKKAGKCAWNIYEICGILLFTSSAEKKGEEFHTHIIKIKKT